MRNESDGTFKVGDRLYHVGRSSDDGKLHLWITELTDIVITKTPTGRTRKPVYRGKAVNRGSTYPDVADAEIDPEAYYQSATNAVSASLRTYFERKCGRDRTPEERMLEAVFGEKPNPRVAATELVDVIYDLKNYHALYAEAFAEDDKRVQAIDLPKENA